MLKKENSSTQITKPYKGKVVFEKRGLLNTEN
jgi:hypothetical protein